VDRLAAGLLRLGVRKGDHVAVWLPNSPEWVLSFFACARIGAPLIPVNTRYKADEVAYILAQSDARALLMTPQMWGTDYYGMLVGLAPELLGQAPGAASLAAFPALRHVIVAQSDAAPPGTTTLDSVVAGAGDLDGLAAAEAGVSPDDLLLICYTSGTTGKPKGAMHNHKVLKQATRVGLALHVEAGDVVLAHMPFYHVAGLYMGLVPAMTLGASLVLMPHWDAGRALELIERERVSMFGGISTHFYDLLNHPTLAERDVGSIKSAWIGGGAVARETFMRIVEGLGIAHLLSSYGMTENTISTTFNLWDDPPEICAENKAPVLADCEVRIVDPETFADRAAGEDGEIWCRGETVMMGYYKNAQATAETITADGWLRTGDIGRFDARGYLSITGRIKEMFKVGGTNAYPAEIEAHLARLPGVKLAVVVGAPDRRLGEVGHAFIERDPGSGLTEQDVIDHCKGRIADYKVPRRVTFVGELPRTTTGKIQRVALAQRARDSIADN
jgi:fatty-acyl-CoA synthase